MPAAASGSRVLAAAQVSTPTATDRVFVTRGSLFWSPNLPVSRIHHLIKQVGLAPQKAKALSGLAQKLGGELGGVVPRTFEELESLPGVGHKTASVVMVQAFGLPAFPVDTHITRIARRWDLARRKDYESIRTALERWTPADKRSPPRHITRRSGGG